ncbi:MAG: HIT family protein [Minisyncoccia bacterium]
MHDCVFCKIADKSIPSHIVYEDENVLAFLDVKPIHSGHTLVIPKEHSRNIFDISKENWQHTAEVVRSLAVSVKEAVGADGINLIMNNEGAAGQEVFHPHIHIIPRFEGDGISTMPERVSSYEEMIHTQETILEKIRSAHIKNI